MAVKSQHERDRDVNERKWSGGLTWAAVAIVAWSGSLVMLRFGVTTSLNSYDLTALRFLTAAAFLLPVFIAKRSAIFGISRVAVVGMVAGFGAPYLVVVSLALVTAPASAAGSLNPGVMAVVSVGLGWKFFGDRFGRTQLAGCVLVGVGSILIAGILGGARFSAGHLFLVATGTMWAAYIGLIRKTGLAALPAAAVVAVGSAVGYLPVYVAFLPKTIDQAPLRDVVVQAGFHGIVVSVVAVFGFNRSLELLGPTIGATLPALIPPTTLVIGWLTLDESTTWLDLSAAGLIGAGVAILLVGTRRPVAIGASPLGNADHEKSTSKKPEAKVVTDTDERSSTRAWGSNGQV